MLTIFSSPKAFKGHNAIIQRNAIKSWTLLSKHAQIILFGNDAGTKEICEEFGITHYPNVKLSEWGTPLLNDIFEQAQNMAKHEVLCYVNADIIFTKQILDLVPIANSFKKNVLLFSQRWDVSVTTPLDYSVPGWEKKLEKMGLDEKLPGPLWGLADYFIFKNGLFVNMPPLAIGRTAFDNWIIYYARKAGAAVVNTTDVIKVYHQRHDYNHIKGGAEEVWRGAEAKKNQALMYKDCYDEFGLYDVTHLLTKNGLKKAWAPIYFARYIVSAPYLYPMLKPFRFLNPLSKRLVSLWSHAKNGKKKIARVFFKPPPEAAKPSPTKKAG